MHIYAFSINESYLFFSLICRQTTLLALKRGRQFSVLTLNYMTCSKSKTSYFQDTKAHIFLTLSCIFCHKGLDISIINEIDWTELSVCTVSQGALVAPLVKRWPVDLAVLDSRHAGGGFLSNRKRDFIAHSLSISHTHRPVMTDIRIKRT